MERSDGFWRIGFSGDGATTLSGIKLPLQGPGLAWNVQNFKWRSGREDVRLGSGLVCESGIGSVRWRRGALGFFLRS